MFIYGNTVINCCCWINKKRSRILDSWPTGPSNKVSVNVSAKPTIIVSQTLDIFKNNIFFIRGKGIVPVLKNLALMFPSKEKQGDYLYFLYFGLHPSVWRTVLRQEEFSDNPHVVVILSCFSTTNFDSFAAKSKQGQLVFHQQIRNRF